MMFTKPCLYAKCTVVIEVKKRWLFERRKYCSESCATQDRMAKGWTPHLFITPEARTKGARLGGRRSGERRHRESLMKAVTACAALLTPELTAGLSARQLAAFKVLLGRAHEIGRFREKQRQDGARRYARKRQQPGEAA